jgi:peptide/nickel transport system permease protein
MARYVMRRLIVTIPVLLGILVITFLLARVVPSHPCEMNLGDKMTPEICARFIQNKGLDRSLAVQFSIYLKDVFRGDFGNSIRFNRPVLQILAERLPATIELSLSAFLIAVMVGIPTGIIAAIKRDSIFDFGSMFGANLGVSTPVFWLALILIYIFAVLFRDTPFWLPPSGRLSTGVVSVPFYEAYGIIADQGSPRYYFFEFLSNLYILNSLITGDFEVLGNTLKHLILPAVALSVIPMAMITRLTRSSLLDEMGTLYILGARAKGLKRKTAIMKHGFPNALLPIVTIMGLQVGGLLSGAVLTETIFSYPGLGRMLFDSIIHHDYPVVMMIILVIAVGYFLINLLVDLSYGFLDPRIRLE